MSVKKEGLIVIPEKVGKKQRKHENVTACNVHMA